MAADYSTGSGSANYSSTLVGIVPGNRSPVSFTITPATDALTEGSETLVITLLDGEGYTLGANTTYTLTITE